MQLKAEIIDKKNLTQTEAKVLIELCCAKQTKSISTALGISIKVIEKHIDHIYEKLGIRWTSVNKRSAAILIAIQSGMIKTTLHLVFAILVFQSLQISQCVIRPGSRVSSITKVRSREV